MIAVTLYAALSSATVPSHGDAPCDVARPGSALINATKCAPAECPINTNLCGSPPHCVASRCAAASAIATSRACCSGGVSGSIG